MKILDLIESNDPFDEPVLTLEEELRYYRRRLAILHEKLAKITHAAYTYYMKTTGIFSLSSSRQKFTGDAVVEIPRLYGRAAVYGLYSTNPNYKRHLNYMLSLRYEAEEIKRRYKLLLTKAERLENKISATKLK